MITNRAKNKLIKVIKILAIHQNIKIHHYKKVKNRFSFRRNSNSEKILTFPLCIYMDLMNVSLNLLRESNYIDLNTFF